MKKRLMFLASFAMLAVPRMADAGVVTLGTGFARSCYEAAEGFSSTSATIETCNRALTEQGLDRHDQVATHVNRGILYYLSGDTASAIRDYDRALFLDPREAEAWLNKGLATLRLGKDDDALPMFTRALELKTVRPALAYYGSGVVHEERGNLRLAYANLVRARDIEPGWSLPREELRRYRVQPH